MATAQDLLVEVGLPGSATTLDSNYTIGDATVTVVSTTNWPATGKPVIFAIDEATVIDGKQVQTAGTYNVFEGIVASATSISNVDQEIGSGDRNYTAGVLTRVYIPVSTENINRIVEWGTAHANQDGTLKDDAVTEDVIADDSITNAKLDTTAGELGGVWTDWTPSYTGFAIEDATVVAKYTQLGKTIHGFLSITFGSSTTITSGIISLPVTAASAFSTKKIIGNIYIDDVSGVDIGGVIRSESTTTMRPLVLNAAGTYATLAGTSGSVPITWVSGDIIEFTFTYEAA
jgi:hypothetical protein